MGAPDETCISLCLNLETLKTRSQSNAPLEQSAKNGGCECSSRVVVQIHCSLELQKDTSLITL